MTRESAEDFARHLYYHATHGEWAAAIDARDRERDAQHEARLAVFVSLLEDALRRWQVGPTPGVEAPEWVTGARMALGIGGAPIPERPSLAEVTAERDALRAALADAVAGWDGLYQETGMASIRIRCRALLATGKPAVTLGEALDLLVAIREHWSPIATDFAPPWWPERVRKLLKEAGR